MMKSGLNGEERERERECVSERRGQAHGPRLARGSWPTSEHELTSAGGPTKTGHSHKRGPSQFL